MAEDKVTRTTIFEAIKKVMYPSAVIAVDDVLIRGSDIIDFCDDAIRQLGRKTERQRERRQEQRPKVDPLLKEILSLMTEKWQTAEEIAPQLSCYGSVTRSQISERLTRLVRYNIVDRKIVKRKKFRKVAYKLPDDMFQEDGTVMIYL